MIEIDDEGVADVTRIQTTPGDLVVATLTGHVMPTPDTIAALRRLQAELGVTVVVVREGVTLQTMTDSDLHAIGLRRVARLH